MQIDSQVLESLEQVSSGMQTMPRSGVSSLMEAGNSAGERVAVGRRTEETAERSALEAIRIGDDESALRILMDAFGPAIYRYCCRMVGQDAADDVRQQVFIQSFEGLRSFRGRSSLRTWLFGIARHRCLDRVKVRRRRWVRFEVSDTPPDRADPGTPIDERLVARSHQAELDDCMAELRPGIRDALILRYQESLSYVEMASLSGERPATLQARVARALPVLKRCLELKGTTL